MLFTPASTTAFTTRGFLATLQLPSLQSSDAGEYLCQASYSLGGYTSPLVNDSFILNVISKLTVPQHNSNYFAQTKQIQPVLTQQQA